MAAYTACINQSNTAVQAVLEQPCLTGGRTGTVRPKQETTGRTDLSDRSRLVLCDRSQELIGQACPTRRQNMQSTDSENCTDVDDGMLVDLESEEEGFFRITKPLSGPSAVMILSEMHGTIGKRVTSVETFAQDEPLPEPSHNHYLQEFKQFRLILTLWKNKAVISKLGYLFKICWTWIIEWDDQEDQEDVKFQIRSAKRKDELHALAATCGSQINASIE
ncbi:hypothetical protein PCANC_21213 [Puccinia coronata f. sp. avenae]|uniref:Uncharacterized protein n=1 Tax=Puccinia coronata f. sp. avenae TaxID=200324 RepID=A0A2N5UGR2_9BASI|nr:hypothetical protein PCANC_21213 [Puccinia coronata f. sp. avenae]